MQTRSIHELKCWPAQFAAIRSGEKRFEIRQNDRHFAIGDEVILSEFDPETETFSGQVEHRMITFLLSEESLGVIHGYVAIGFGPLPSQEPALGDGDLMVEDLIAWHAKQSDNAALRAEEAGKVAEGYRTPKEGRQAMLVAADRNQAVADAAAAEARFHAAAVAIWERYV